MDLKFEEMKCPCCKTQTMGGAGGSFGGRITSVKLKCLTCDLTLLIIPMEKKYSYELSATTPEERKEMAIKKAKEESELELARKITQIKEGNF